MSWISALSETYDACIVHEEYQNDPVPLLPICHTTNQAQVEITIGPSGEFLGAQVVDKNHQSTVMPCTEESAGRTSGLSPYPLDDKLQYLAPDIDDRYWKGDEKNKVKIPRCGYSEYIDQLKDWAKSEYTCEKVEAVYKYVSKGNIIQDLVDAKILFVSEDGRFLSRTSITDKPLINQAKLQGEQSDIFLRWRIDIPEDPVKDSWKDETIRSKWIDYYLSKKTEKGLCYVSGQMEPLAINHPSKIRNSGDKAKLISSDNKNTFTYSGRFDNPEQACGVSYLTTQKAHNALRWLIGRQAYREGDLCIVTWSLVGNEIPNPIDAYYDPFSDGECTLDIKTKEASIRVNNRIRGFDSKLISDKLMIMAIDSATTGRLSILYYREYLGQELISRLNDWFESITWKHNFGYRTNSDGKNEHYSFIGAPSPRDIAKVVHGENADSKVIAETVRRILPCIMDGTPVPGDIVDSAIRRASNPNSFSNKQLQDKAITVSCSLYNKKSRRKYSMVLEKDRTSRDYLYGRLLATAELMESAALKKSGETRQTNAERLMQRFSECPYTTWRSIELSLQPYKSRIGPKLSNYYDGKIAEIMDLFNVDDFKNNSKLSGEYLIGYHCQKEDQYKKKTVTEEEE